MHGSLCVRTKALEQGRWGEAHRAYTKENGEGACAAARETRKMRWDGLSCFCLRHFCLLSSLLSRGGVVEERPTGLIFRETGVRMHSGRWAQVSKDTEAELLMQILRRVSTEDVELGRVQQPVRLSRSIRAPSGVGRGRGGQRGARGPLTCVGPWARVQCVLEQRQEPLEGELVHVADVRHVHQGKEKHHHLGRQVLRSDTGQMGEGAGSVCGCVQRRGAKAVLLGSSANVLDVMPWLRAGAQHRSGGPRRI